MKVALDLDSTLAATSTTAFDLMDEDYTYDDITSWSWGTDKFGTARYLNALWHAWTIRPEEIPPMEDGLQGTTAHIHDRVDQLDVVTAHPDGMMGVDDGKKQWLEDHGIVYDYYVPVDEDKADLDYDVYIDDKPTLAQNPGDATVLLRDQPYNRDIPNMSVSTVRVHSVREASEWLPKKF